MVGSGRRIDWPLGAAALLGLLVHGAWALTILEPHDWDALYYREVAENVAAGRGPVIDALFHLSVLPEALPAAADDYWMPLPSRVLVPLIAALGPAGGPLTAVLLAATWPTLGLLLARDLGLPRDAQAVAVMLGLFPGTYVRLVGTTDVYALCGALGGLAIWALARSAHATRTTHTTSDGPWIGLAAAALTGLALSRNDGFLVAPFLALGARRWPHRLLLAAVGPLAAAGWLGWVWHLHGPTAFGARRLAHDATAYVQVFEGTPVAPLGIGERALRTVGALGDIVEAQVAPLLLIGVLLAAVGAIRHRGRPWVRAAVACWAVQPWLDVLLAPGVATHGTLDRSVAVVFVPLIALAAAGGHELARLGARRRGYPRAFVLGLSVGSVAVTTVARGLTDWAAADPDPCAGVDETPPDAVVFTTRPLPALATCGRRAVILTAGVPAASAQQIAERYRVTWAVTSAATGRPDEGGLTDEVVQSSLPGWSRVGDGLWTAPAR